MSSYSWTPDCPLQRLVELSKGDSNKVNKNYHFEDQYFHFCNLWSHFKDNLNLLNSPRPFLQTSNLRWTTSSRTSEPSFYSWTLDCPSWATTQSPQELPVPEEPLECLKGTLQPIQEPIEPPEDHTNPPNDFWTFPKLRHMVGWHDKMRLMRGNISPPKNCCSASFSPSTWTGSRPAPGSMLPSRGRCSRGLRRDQEGPCWSFFCCRHRQWMNEYITFVTSQVRKENTRHRKQ